MLVVTISTCLILLITIDGEFFSFNHTRKLTITYPTTTRSSTKNLSSHIVLSFTRGRGSIPTRGTEREHGGTADTDITNKFLAE